MCSLSTTTVFVSNYSMACSAVVSTTVGTIATTATTATTATGYLELPVPHMFFFAVTTSNQAIDALNLLRSEKGRFDLVISDVHMPDMDGFKLLELVGLEMDLPVISNLSSQAFIFPPFFIYRNVPSINQ